MATKKIQTPQYSELFSGKFRKEEEKEYDKDM